MHYFDQVLVVKVKETVLSVCLTGFAGPTLCTTTTIQSYPLNHQSALYSSVSILTAEPYRD